MHAARLENSERLQHTLAVLQGGPKTTAQIMAETGSCAVHSDVAELRHGGIPVACRLVRVDRDTRRRVYEYALGASV